MSVEKKVPTDIKKMSFEAALDELEEIVRTLEAGDGNLDDAIDAYARGALLKCHCENKLMDAKTRIDKVVLGAEGDPHAEPLDTE